MNEISVKNIKVQELKERMSADSSLLLIDVRENDEWQSGHIPGALHIRKDEVATRIKDYAPDLTTPIYLHCKAGVRSLYAATQLLHMGYSEVYSIDNGIMAWVEAGYAVE